MDRNQPVKLMLRTNEEVQMFLISHPDGDFKLSDLNIISYAMIRLSSYGGPYTKAIENWQSKTKEDKSIWGKLRQNLIAEYGKLLAEGGGTTLGQERYGTAFNSTEYIMDKSFITESIFCYAEHGTAEEGKLQTLEELLNQLEI